MIPFGGYFDIVRLRSRQRCSNSAIVAVGLFSVFKLKVVLGNANNELNENGLFVILKLSGLLKLLKNSDSCNLTELNKLRLYLPLQDSKPKIKLSKIVL